MLIDGEKWACEACVRGHRVSNCQHHGELFSPLLPCKLPRRHRHQVAPRFRLVAAEEARPEPSAQAHTTTTRPPWWGREGRADTPGLEQLPLNAPKFNAACMPSLQFPVAG
jgi:hypothetical protein